MVQTPFDEQRDFTRVSIAFPARLTLAGGRTIDGQVHDLCVRGALYTGDVELSEGTPCGLELYERAGEDVPIVRANAQTGRCTPFGTAIEFLELDLKSFGTLKRVLAAHCSDPARIEREFEAWVDFEEPNESD